MSKEISSKVLESIKNGINLPLDSRYKMQSKKGCDNTENTRNRESEREFIPMLQIGMIYKKDFLNQKMGPQMVYQKRFPKGKSPNPQRLIENEGIYKLQKRERMWDLRICKMSHGTRFESVYLSTHCAAKIFNCNSFHRLMFIHSISSRSQHVISYQILLDFISNGLYIVDHNVSFQYDVSHRHEAIHIDIIFII